jgi:hypothetical protein
MSQSPAMDSHSSVGLPDSPARGHPTSSMGALGLFHINHKGPSEITAIPPPSNQFRLLFTTVVGLAVFESTSVQPL